MRLHHIRQWHWVTAGVLAGLLIGGGRAAWGPAYRSSTARTLSQSLFERATLTPPGTTPHLSELVVHPPDPTGAYWVTGRYEERSGRQTESAEPAERAVEFKFRGATPYRPKFAVDTSDPDRLTVADFLDQVAARVPQAGLSYRYAWEEQPGRGLLAWIAGSTFLVGVIWPALLQRLPGSPPPDESAGGTDPRPPARTTPPPRAAPIRAGRPEPGLDAVPDGDVAAVGPTATIRESDSATPGGEDEASAPPVRLAAHILRPKAAPAPTPPKDYAGEFYPTTAHAKEPNSGRP